MKGCAGSFAVVDDFLIDAACFLACSSASFSDSAKAALSSSSSSSSLVCTFTCVSFLGCGLYAVPDVPFASSRLISSALLRSCSYLSLTLASRGCIELGFVANETRLWLELCDFFVNFS